MMDPRASSSARIHPHSVDSARARIVERPPDYGREDDVPGWWIAVVVVALVGAWVLVLLA